MVVKKGDQAVVISGKEKGKKGKVAQVIPSTGKVVIENVNVVSRHKKPRSAQDKGGIMKKAAPIDASNVMVVCPACGKATRVAHKEIAGEKARVCKKCGASLDKDMKKQVKKDAKAETKAAKAETTKAEKSAKTEQKSKSSTAAKKPAAKKAENKD
ncbi:MAG: 50S ribosomal protein L24 [Christensenellales bacterium]